MGEKNSSLTRVQPLFDYLNQDINQLNDLFSLLSNKIRISSEIERYQYGFNEVGIKPPKSLLLWCVENTDKLKKSEIEKVKKETRASSKERAKLFDGDPIQKQKAIDLLNKNFIPQKDWFVFEGYTRPDIYIETNDQIIVAEAKRTEPSLTIYTTWLDERDQLIRHIDSVIESEKKVSAFFILENPNLYPLSNYSDLNYYKKSLPHRNIEITKKIFDSYCGVITWGQIQKLFPELVFPDIIEEED